MSLARDIVDRIFFPDRDVHAIPVLDGGFSPNERLNGAPVLGAPFDAPDALAVDDRGTLYVSSGRRILSCSGADFDTRGVVVEFEDSVGALAWSPRTGPGSSRTSPGCWRRSGSRSSQRWCGRSRRPASE